MGRLDPCMQVRAQAAANFPMHPLRRAAKLTNKYSGSDLVEAVKLAVRTSWHRMNPPAASCTSEGVAAGSDTPPATRRPDTAVANDSGNGSGEFSASSTYVYPYMTEADLISSIAQVSAHKG
jgi:hypothetical protein